MRAASSRSFGSLEIAEQQPGAEQHQHRICADHRNQRVAELEPVDDIGERQEEERLRHQVDRREPGRA